MADGMRREFRTAHSWVATVASVAALGFSGYNLSQLHENPNTDVTLPVSLKLSWDEDGTSVFIQPTVFTRFDTEDVEMVTDVQLRLRPESAKPPWPEFYWRRNVKWSLRHDVKVDDQTSTWWEFDSDPAPFTVTQATPQMPSMQFRTNNWTLTPGRYVGSVTLHRASTRDPIERPFCLVLRPENITEITKGEYWFELRNDVPGKRQGGCYHWYR